MGCLPNSQTIRNENNPKEMKDRCQVREVSDNELIERKQQPTQSVGLITDETTVHIDPKTFCTRLRKFLLKEILNINSKIQLIQEKRFLDQAGVVEHRLIIKVAL